MQEPQRAGNGSNFLQSPALTVTGRPADDTSHQESEMRTDPSLLYLTTPEAAKFLRLRPATLARWRCVGGGPPFRKFGGRVVYSQEELKAYAEATRRVSTSDPGAAKR